MSQYHENGILVEPEFTIRAEGRGVAKTDEQLLNLIFHALMLSPTGRVRLSVVQEEEGLKG